MNLVLYILIHLACYLGPSTPVNQNSNVILQINNNSVPTSPHTTHTISPAPASIISPHHQYQPQQQQQLHHHQVQQQNHMGPPVHLGTGSVTTNQMVGHHAQQHQLTSGNHIQAHLHLQNQKSQGPGAPHHVQPMQQHYQQQIPINNNQHIQSGSMF